MLDLFAIYKKFYQRSHDNPFDYEYEVMTDLVHDLVKNLYKCRFDEVKREEAVADSIQIAQELQAIEFGKERLRTFHSPHLLRALEVDEYTIDVPFPVKPRWEDPDYGYLYIFTSDSRLGECKLGATSMDINTRANKYMNKYGYSVEVYYASPLILNPFQYELAIGRMYKEFRCIGHVYGDSIEWYNLDPTILRDQILEIL